MLHSTTMQRHGAFDKVFIGITGFLVVGGFFLFASASLSVLAEGTESVASIAFSQILLGLGGGLLAFSLAAHVPYRMYRVVAPYIFGAGVLGLFLVFVPGLGFEANGARRWVALFGVSVQPAEFAKLASIVFLAWYYSVYYRKMNNVFVALGGVGITLVCVGVPLVLQPDIGTLTIITAIAGAVLVAAGVRWRYLLAAFGVVAVALLLIVAMRPYVLERVTTFLNPLSADVRDEGYQIRQSLIAVGSGGWFGKGYGQGVQKFGYLPEATSDSVFSVASEELGFVGAVGIIALFIAFAFRGLRIAMHARDRFGALLVTGVVILIVVQSFLNIGSMLAVLPLTGEPLVFMSHGGSSLFFALLAVGVVTNVSRYARKSI